jgi:hypothetical protein
MKMPEPIIGWELGFGGGPEVKLLPTPPREIPLVPASDQGVDEDYVTLVSTDVRRVVTVDIWGLDPRLTVACAFSRVPSSNAHLGGLPLRKNITATIAAYTLTRGATGVTQGAPISSAGLFLNGGALDVLGVDGNDDGCELSTAAQGVRFVLTVTRTSVTSHDIVLSLQCRPNVALVCRELALALAAGMTVTIPDPVIWRAGA